MAAISTAPNLSSPIQPCSHHTGVPVSLARRRPQSLLGLLTLYETLPAQTGVFGLGEDGLPLLLDWLDERPGAVMAAGEHTEDLRSLLQCIALSTTILSAPREVQLVMITDDVLSWSAKTALFDADRHIAGLVASTHPAAAEWINWLTRTAAARSQNQAYEPVILLLIDDPSFLDQASIEAQQNFDWLVQHGPSLKIWPIVSFQYASPQWSAPRFQLFSTVIYGHNAQGMAENGFDFPSPENFRGHQFCVRLGDEWFAFSLPDLYS